MAAVISRFFATVKTDWRIFIYIYISLRLENAKMISDGFLKECLIKCSDNQRLTRFLGTDSIESIF